MIKVKFYFCTCYTPLCYANYFYNNFLTGANAKEVISHLENKFKTLVKQWPNENENVDAVYLEWLGGKSTDKADHMLYTDYHEVEKMTNSLAIKW